VGDGGYEKINIFNLGEKGVVNAKDPLHVVDGELMQSQNAIANNPDEGLGGLEKRGGMAKLNASAMSGSVQSVANVPLEDPVSGYGEWIYAPYKGSGVQFFCSGAAYDFYVTNGVGLLTGTDNAPGLPSPTGTRQYDTKLAAAFPGSTNYRGTGMARDTNRLYYAADDYVLDTDAPPIRCFTGTKDFEVARIPEWFNAGVRTACKAIIRLFSFNSYIYVTTWDGGSGTNLQGRVFRLDPNTGTLLQIGQAFGNQAGELAGGMPFAACGWNGRLWVGTANGDAAPAGKVYWIRPGVDTTWTLDHTCAANQGNVLCMTGYSGTGNLYVGTDGVGGAMAALVVQRTPAGVWSTADTGGKVVTRNRYDVIQEHQGNLYVHYYTPSAAPAAGEQVIRKFDGTTWSTDADIVAIHAAAGDPLGQTRAGSSALALNGLLIFAYGLSPTVGGNAVHLYTGTWHYSGVSAYGGGDVPLGYIRSDTALNVFHT
jgi:hypothetical protein